MKRYTLHDLPLDQQHILAGIIPGQHLSAGGIGFKAPNQRSHDVGCDCKHCDGRGRHVHDDDHEVFIILAGKAVMQIDGTDHPLTAGDVIVCAPGEDHHLVADADNPCVNLFLHAGKTRHPSQLKSG